MHFSISCLYFWHILLQKFNTDRFIAMVIAAALVYPTIVSAYSDKHNLAISRDARDSSKVYKVRLFQQF